MCVVKTAKLSRTKREHVKAKISELEATTRPLRCVSTILQLRARYENQPNVPAALHPGKMALLPAVQEAARPPDPMWTLRTKAKLLTPTENRALTP